MPAVWACAWPAVCKGGRARRGFWGHTVHLPCCIYAAPPGDLCLSRIVAACSAPGPCAAQDPVPLSQFDAWQQCNVTGVKADLTGACFGEAAVASNTCSIGRLTAARPAPQNSTAGAAAACAPRVPAGAVSCPVRLSSRLRVPLCPILRSHCATRLALSAHPAAVNLPDSEKAGAFYLTGGSSAGGGSPAVEPGAAPAPSDEPGDAPGPADEPGPAPSPEGEGDNVFAPSPAPADAAPGATPAPMRRRLLRA